MQVRGSLVQLTAVVHSQSLSSKTGIIIEIARIKAILNQLEPSRKSNRDLVSCKSNQTGKALKKTSSAIFIILHHNDLNPIRNKLSISH